MNRALLLTEIKENLDYLDKKDLYHVLNTIRTSIKRKEPKNE